MIDQTISVVGLLALFALVVAYLFRTKIGLKITEDTFWIVYSCVYAVLVVADWVYRPNTFSSWFGTGALALLVGAQVMSYLHKRKSATKDAS